MSTYKRKDRKFYVGEAVKDEAALRAYLHAGRWFYEADGLGHYSRPIHPAWFSNRAFHIIDAMLQEGRIFVAEENSEYCPFPGQDARYLHDIVKQLIRSQNDLVADVYNIGYLIALLKDVEDRHPWFKKMKTEEA